MKRKSRKSRPPKKNKVRRSPRVKLQRTKSRKRRSTVKKLRRYLTFKNERQTLAHQKALRALRLMREEGLSLSAAARREHIKQNTFLRHVGSAVHRSGHGKPWKASKSDSLRARMRILTPQGPVFDVVRGLRERKLLASYEKALRKFRAGEDGAEKELSAFRGLTVGGHVFITDLKLLIQLEEAGQLDFDSLYFSVGGAS
jgi:predicted DNA-binding protein (UPF0251 family)